MEKPTKESEKAIKDLEPKATEDVRGGFWGRLTRVETLKSNVQKKADDTASSQQQKIG